MYMTTFADIERWYANIAPVISHLHTAEDDIRPLGKRSRKWERIIKINKNKYALSCGAGWVWHNDKTRIPADQREWMRKHTIANATFIWERKPDGTEFVRVRNNCAGSNSSIRFFRENSPRGWYYVGRNKISIDGKHYHLPANDMKPWVEFYREFKQQDYWRGAKTPKSCASLLFKRTETGWELQNEERPEPVKRTRVLKAKKKQVKPIIDTMRDYIESISGMFIRPVGYVYNQRANNPEYEQFQSARNHSITALREMAKTYGGGGWYNDWMTKTEFMTDVFSNTEHELYYDMAYAIWLYTNGDVVTDIDSLRAWRGRYNKFVNKALALTTTVTKFK